MGQGSDMTPEERRLHKTLMFGYRYGLHNATMEEVARLDEAMKRVITGRFNSNKPNKANEAKS